jgi:aspartate/methionine/tyrosine aminotransferase
MPSSRLPASLTANAVTRRLAALRADGVDVLDLTESNPTRAGITYPAGLLDALADPLALSYDPHPLGLLSAREAVAADFARRGLVVDPGRIALTASTSEAYGLLFKLLCDPGDDVLVPTPSYPLFEHLAALDAVCVRPYLLERQGSWRIDLASLTDACTSRTRAVLVVSPNNPTGSWLHHDDLAELAAFCADRRLALIGDEVFADYGLEDAPHKVSVLEQSRALTFALGGLSKSVGLPQVKLGWMAVGGPEPDVQVALDAYEIAADTYLSVSTPVQVAAPSLMRNGAVVRDTIRARTRRNLDALRTIAAGFPEITVLPVEAGWSVVLQVPAVRTEDALVLDLLDRDHVLVHPGYFFDFPHEAFLIVSLLVEPVVFDVAIGRMLSRATSARAALGITS